MNTYSTYMRPDPCVRQHLVEQGVALYRQMIATHHGRIVFLAGEASMGGGATLHGLADALRQQSPKPFLIGGQFVQGRYTPWSAVQNGAIVDLVGNIVSLLGIGLTGSPLLASLAGVLGQLLQTSAAAHAVTQDFYQKQQRTAADVLDPLVLYRPLRRAALDRPVVCVLEQFDQAEGSWWNSFLLEKALEITQLPILFLVSVEGPQQLPTTLAGEEPDIVAVAHRLCVERNLVDWQPLLPLTYAEVEAWVGRAESVLPHRLYEVTGGNPTWLRELWLDWFERGLLYARTEDLVWRCAAQIDPSALGTVQDVLVRRLRSLLPDFDALERDQVSELLAVAALEGRTFTAAALAQATQRDADQVIDLFDDFLLWQEDSADGLLEEAEPILIRRPGGEQTLWRYRFVAELHWLTLLHGRLTASEQQQWATALAPALEQCYAPAERRIAPTLARLYADAGNHARSHDFQRMADIATDRELLHAQAHQIMTTQWAGWTQLDYARAARLLYEAGSLMLYYYPYPETAQVFAATYDAATQAQLLFLQAAALNGLGLAHRYMEKVKEALDYHNQALPLVRQVGDKGGEATTLNNLGLVYSDLGDKAQALAYYNQALPLRRQVGAKGGEATTLNNLGMVYSDLGDKAQALDYFNQALPLRRQVGDKGGEATTLHNIGHVYHDLSEYDKALDYYHQGLSLTQEIDDKRTQAKHHYCTALTHIAMGDLITAEEQLQKSVALATAVQHPDLARYQAKLAEVQALRRQKAEEQE